jgi:hypothetical protein
MEECRGGMKKRKEEEELRRRILRTNAEEGVEEEGKREM